MAGIGRLYVMCLRILDCLNVDHYDARVSQVARRIAEEEFLTIIPDLLKSVALQLYLAAIELFSAFAVARTWEFRLL